jgi:hypothetical protein
MWERSTQVVQRSFHDDATAGTFSHVETADAMGPLAKDVPTRELLVTSHV